MRIMRPQEDFTDTNPSNGTDSEISQHLHEARSATKSNPRIASLSKFHDQPLGVCVVLTAADLTALGINPSGVTTVLYWIDPDEQQLCLSGQDQ